VFLSLPFGEVGGALHMIYFVGKFIKGWIAVYLGFGWFI
jgi:hypothetical protein